MPNTEIPKGRKLLTFFSLYIAQAIPMSFFSTILPVIMRQQDFSLELIGALQFLKLPWILKFLWSPAIDRSCYSLGAYKRWIFSSEIIYAVIIFSVSFLDFELTPVLIIGLILLSFIASATQDIATDALAVISFKRKDKSMVNSMQSMGSFAGAMIGGGVLLLLYDRMGWGKILPFMALFVLIAVLPLFFFKKTDIEGNIKKEMPKAHPNDLFGFFKQKGISKQVVFLLLYYSGLMGIMAMLKPMLVDFGYSMFKIGVMSGIVGTSVACITSLLGGLVVRRLGRTLSCILFSVAAVLTAVYFVLLYYVFPVNTATLHLGISLLWGSYGMATVVVYTIAMDHVRKGYEGTDFTIQIVIAQLSGMILAVAAGKLAGMYNYGILFSAEVVLAFVALIYVSFIYSRYRRVGQEQAEE